MACSQSIGCFMAAIGLEVALNLFNDFWLDLFLISWLLCCCFIDIIFPFKLQTCFIEVYAMSLHFLIWFWLLKLELGKMSKYSGICKLFIYYFLLLLVVLPLIYYPFWILWSTRLELVYIYNQSNRYLCKHNLKISLYIQLNDVLQTDVTIHQVHIDCNL